MALDGEIEGFLQRQGRLLHLVGPRGTGKSEKVAKLLARLFPPGEVASLGLVGKPWTFYKELYWAKDKAVVVLNEAKGLLKDGQSMELLKLLTEQKRVTTVRWSYTTPGEMRMPADDPDYIPREFGTGVKVVVIANWWPEGNADVDAIQSRGPVLYFWPPGREMHEYASTWYREAGIRQDVYEFVGRYMAEFEEPDLRIYQQANGRANHVNKYGIHWEDWVRSKRFAGPRRVAWDLLRDDKFKSNNERAEEYHRLTGQSARTFYRVADELRGRLRADALPATRQHVKPGLTV